MHECLNNWLNIQFSMNEKIKNRTEKILFDLFFTYYNYYIMYNKISVQWRKFYHILPSNHKISVRSIIVDLNTRPLNAWISVHELFQEPWRKESSKKRQPLHNRHLEKDNVDDSQFWRYYIVLSFFVSFSSLYPFSPCHSFYRRPVIISRLTGRSLIYDLPKAKLNFPPVIYTFWHFDLPSEIEPRFSST